MNVEEFTSLQKQYALALEELRMHEAAEVFMEGGSWLYDIDRGTFSVSKGWQAIHGTTQSTFTMQSLMPIAHPDDVAAIEAAFANSEKNGASYHLTHRIIRQNDRHVRTVDAYAEVVEKDIHGKPSKMFGMVKDVTSFSSTVSARNRAMERARLAKEVAGIGIFEFTPQTGELVWDDRIYELYGLENKPVTYEDWRNTLHPDDLSDTEAELTRALESNKTFDSVFRIICHEKIKYIHCVMSPVEGKMIGVNLDVTELKEASEKSSFLAKMAELSGASMSITDSEGRVLWVNGKYETDFGVTLEAVQGREQQHFLLGPDSDRSLVKRMGETLKQGENVVEEIKLQRKNGTAFWANVTISPVVDHHQITNLIHIFNDIDESKRQREALAVANRKLSLVMQGSQDGFWHWVDVDQNLVEWSDKTYELFGYQPNEFESSLDNYMLMVHPDDVDMIETAIKRAMTSKEKYDIQYRVRKKSGAYSWFRDRGIAFHDADGKLVEMAGSVSNIDELINYQESLNQANQQLNETILRLNQSIRASKVGIWDRDLRTNKSQYSKEYIQQIGYEVEEFGDEYADFESRVHPDDLQRVQQFIEQNLQSGTQDHPIEFRFRHKDGSYRWILSNAAIISDEQGKPMRMLGSHLDITEQKKLESELRQSQKMEAVGQLAGGVAHDFNNQLASIMGFAEILASHLSDSPLKGYIDKIVSGVETSGNLTKQLLAFSRKNSLTLESLDIHALIIEAMDILSRSIDKRIQLKTALNASQHWVVGDKTLLQSAILNLCLNARDAMPDGGILTITTEYLDEQSHAHESVSVNTAEGPCIRIRFTDTGTGIAEQERRKIFEPFYTTKDMGVGTGLGLAAVYSTVTQLNGDIVVESEVGVGSCFTVTLPLSKESVRSEQTPTPASVADKPDKKGQRILVAEDEEMLRALCADFFKAMGHKGLFAANGLEAVEIYKAHWRDIDMVMLDMMMPEMNGIDAFRIMKQINPSVKVIVASGYNAESTSADLLSEGVKTVLAKPFRLVQLSAAIDALSDG